MDLKAFSTPLEGDFAGLASSMSFRLVQSSIERVAALAVEHGVAPPAVDAAKLRRPYAAMRALSPEMSAVRVGLSEAPASSAVEWLVAQLGVAAYLAELAPTVGAAVAGPAAISVGGRVVAGRDLRIEADDVELRIDAGTGQRSCFRRVQREGLAPLWARQPEEDVVPLGSSAAILFSDGDWLRHWPVGTLVAGYSDRAACNRSMLAEACAVLEEQLPELYLWVVLLLREVVPLVDMGPGSTASQSFVSLLGHIHVSLSTPVQTIIMLLHECSHLYFHLARRYGPMAKADAPEVYSPLKNRPRPLEKILLGYHAFGIALMAITMLRERRVGLPAAELDGQIVHLGRLVDELDAALLRHGERHLEESGRTLYLPLRSRLEALGRTGSAKLT